MPLFQVDISRGIDAQTSPLRLEKGRVVDAKNFLFENGHLISRPGLVTSAIASFPAGSVVLAARGFDIDNGRNIVLVKDGATYRLYTIITGYNGTYGAATEITGAGIFGLTESTDMFAEVVNGAILIGGNTVFIRWVPGAAAYTLPANIYNKYVTSAFNRAVSAYYAGNVLGTITVAWSVDGDETDWAGFGSGSTVLADSDGRITGLASCRNIVVVARAGGFHLGHATGQASPAFRWDRHSRGGQGVLMDSTLAVYEDVCYFVSREGVHTFDLERTHSIGNQINNELMDLIHAGGLFYRGFISRGYRGGPRPQYHLTPATPVLNDPYPPKSAPHFVYDITDGVWSRHLYPTFTEAQNYIAFSGLHTTRSLYGPGSMPITSERSSVFFLRSGGSGLISRWNSQTVCEADASLRSGVMLIGEPDRNVNVSRIESIYKSAAEIAGARLKIRGSVGGSIQEQENGDGFQGENRWRRRFFNVDTPGNLWELEMDLPAGHQIEIDSMGLQITDAGEALEE